MGTRLGLPVTALIFHPYFVDEYSMTCEGLGQWRGQPAWQVRFRQRNDRPSRIRGYQVKHIRYPVKLKGRAWVAADSHQVARLETDRAEEIPAIRLPVEHLAIEYRSVQFQKRRVEPWLPASAELYFDFKGHRHHRRHSFSDFQLFLVDTSQQIRDPAIPRLFGKVVWRTVPPVVDCDLKAAFQRESFDAVSSCQNCP